MRDSIATVEPQYQIQVENYSTLGPVQLGLTTSHLWRSDPRHLSFLLARYKAVSKLLSGKREVLELGCGDAFAIDIILQEVASVHAVDFDPIFVQNAKQISKGRKNCTFDVLDFTICSTGRKFDAVYALDVIEHIPLQKERNFMCNIIRDLRSNGICILGSPSLESQKHASIWSKAGHVNCKGGTELRKLMLEYFQNAFLFSMNDEVIHLGFYPMAHYLLCVGVGPKKQRDRSKPRNG